MRLLLAGLFFSVCALPQTPGGLPPPALTNQQIADMFTGISRHAARLQPMLDEIRADEWVAKGAPDTYIAQRKSAIEQLQAIQGDISDLAQHPENMTGDMKALFRIEAFHRALDSLLDGLRRYQNPALAELIQSVAAEDRGDLDKLEQYILDLAGEKEQQFAVADSEAQRCRATLSKQPAQPAGTRRP
jgi:hypothetical protein